MKAANLLKKSSLICFAGTSVSLPGFLKHHRKGSENILWIPRLSFRYFLSDAFLWDMATLKYFTQHQKKFEIRLGPKIGDLNGKKIFYTIRKGFNFFGFEDYTWTLHQLVERLEKQDNVLVPGSHEVKFWENKGFMHQQFKEVGVSEPESFRLRLDELREQKYLSFPYLIKEEHSSSAMGLYKIESRDDLEKILANKSFIKKNEHVIIQQLINMRADCRVIVVGDEVVHHYWRINQGKDWRPTSTGFGSLVDFKNFPEKWRPQIIQTLKELNMKWGGFDITWQNDDRETVPLFLEVSPAFQPNPEIENMNGRPYSYYKDGFSLTKSFEKRFFKLICKIREKQMDLIFSKAVKNQNSVTVQN